MFFLLPNTSLYYRENLFLYRFLFFLLFLLFVLVIYFLFLFWYAKKKVHIIEFKLKQIKDNAEPPLSKLWYLHDSLLVDYLFQLVYYHYWVKTHNWKSLQTLLGLDDWEIQKLKQSFYKDLSLDNTVENPIKEKVMKKIK